MSRRDRGRTVVVSLLLHLLVLGTLLLWKTGLPRWESPTAPQPPTAQATVREREPVASALPPVTLMREPETEPPVFLARTGREEHAGARQVLTEDTYRAFLDRLELPKAIQVPPLSMAYADETAVWEVKTFFGERDVITDGAAFIEVTSLHPLRYEVLPWFNPEAWGNRRKDRLTLPAYRQALSRVVQELGLEGGRFRFYGFVPSQEHRYLAHTQLQTLERVGIKSDQVRRMQGVYQRAPYGWIFVVTGIITTDGRTIEPEGRMRTWQP